MHAQYLISIQLILQAPLKLFQNSLGVRIQSSPTFFCQCTKYEDNIQLILQAFLTLFQKT